MQEAPEGPEWLHEIKFDGYRMHARLDRGAVRLLTRTGLDWTHKYPAIAAAVSSLGARQAYLDGELCGVCPDGITSFSMIQAGVGRRQRRRARVLPVRSPVSRRRRPQRAAAHRAQGAARRLAVECRAHPCNTAIIRSGAAGQFHQQACAMSLEGIVSKRADAPYTPGNRGLWLKVKCLNREEFVVVGWTDPEGTRPYLGALAARLLRSRRPAGLCRPRRQRHQSGGAGAAVAIACSRSPPTRCRWKCRRRAPAVSARRWCLSRVHWVRPELVAEVKFLTWTEDNLLRQVVYEGLREDKPAAEVRRSAPRAKNVGPEIVS